MMGCIEGKETLDHMEGQGPPGCRHYGKKNDITFKLKFNMQFFVCKVNNQQLNNLKRVRIISGISCFIFSISIPMFTVNSNIYASGTATFHRETSQQKYQHAQTL